MKSLRKFTLLLYDARWGLRIFGPPESDAIYQVSSDWSLLLHADVVFFHVPTSPHPAGVRKQPGQKIAEQHPLHHLCDLVLARGCAPPGAASIRKADAWLWRRPVGALRIPEQR